MHYCINVNSVVPQAIGKMGHVAKLRRGGRARSSCDRRGGGEQKKKSTFILKNNNILLLLGTFKRQELAKAANSRLLLNPPPFCGSILLIIRRLRKRKRAKPQNPVLLLLQKTKVLRTELDYLKKSDLSIGGPPPTYSICCLDSVVFHPTGGCAWEKQTISPSVHILGSNNFSSRRSNKIYLSIYLYLSSISFIAPPLVEDLCPPVQCSSILAANCASSPYQKPSEKCTTIIPTLSIS